MNNSFDSSRNGELMLTRYEVAIAVNVDAPYRYAQDILWLEVVAPNDKAASLAASEWVRQAPPNFEATGMLRYAHMHANTLGVDHKEIGRASCRERV